MVLACIASECKNKYGSPVSFYGFPFKRPEILKQWINVVQMQNGTPTWTPHQKTKICSEHFLPSDFQERLGSVYKYNILKTDAIPSIFKSREIISPPREIKIENLEMCPSNMELTANAETQVIIKQENDDDFTFAAKPNDFTMNPSSIKHIAMEESQIAINQEKNYDFPISAELDVNDKKQILNSMTIKFEDVKIEPLSYESELNNLNREVKFSEGSKMVGNDIFINRNEDKNMLSCLNSSQQQQKNGTASGWTKKIYSYNFTCDQCDFGTTQLRFLESHRLKHKNHKEMIKLKCDVCKFETLHEEFLRQHMKRHKPEEFPIYKCEQCNYQTLYKQSIQQHNLRHKNPDEVVWYKCDQCDYRAVHKRLIKNHLLIHKKSDEVEMYKCNECDFQTIRKHTLNQHNLKHKKPNEVVWYKCNQCRYKAVYKKLIRSHLLTHRNPDKTYKCDQCDFQTARKKHLKVHLLKHKISDEVNVYKCYRCDYQTVHK